MGSRRGHSTLSSAARSPPPRHGQVRAITFAAVAYALAAAAALATVVRLLLSSRRHARSLLLCAYCCRRAATPGLVAPLHPQQLRCCVAHSFCALTVANATPHSTSSHRRICSRRACRHRCACRRRKLAGKINTVSKIFIFL